MPEEAAAPAPSATPSAATGAPEAAGQASGAAFAPDAGGKALGGGKDDDEDGEGLQLFDVDDDEEEEEDLPLNPESDECVDTRPRLRGFELVKFLNSNAKKHYRIFMRTISLVGIATADQLVRFAQVYGWLKPKHAKKAMGELRILASGGYLKSVRGPVQAFVFPDSSVCALYGCERRAAFANSFDWHNVLDLCCLRNVPDSMPQSRVAIAVDLNERLLRYLEACRSLFDEERWQLFLDSVTYRNFRVEVECFYECPPDSCWIAWPGAPVDEKPRSWLFVPTKEEGLPELASPAFGSGCYAFWEGTWWKWRKGAWENNPAPLPDGRSLQTGTKPAPDAPSAKHASSETPEAESEALARPESQAPEQAQARARAEASSTAKHAGTDADSPAQAHDGSVAPAPDEPLVPESGETVSLAPSRPSRQLGQFLCSNSTRQYRQLLFVLAIFGIATTDQLLRYCTLHGLIKDPVKARRDLGILASRRFIKVVGEGEGKALAYPAQAWHAGELGAGTLGPSEKTGWKRIIPDSVPQSRIDLILALNERFVRLLEQAKPLLGAARFREFFALCALYTFRIEAPALFLDDFVPCRLALPDDPVDSAAASWLFVPTAEEGLPDIVSVAEGGACFACFENAWWKWEEGVWIPDRDSAPTPPDGTAGPGGPDGSGGSGGPQGETKAGTLAAPGSRGEAGVKAKADAKGAVASPAAKGAVEASPPRKRGRPRKAKPAEAASRASPATAPGPVPATKAEIGQTAGAEAAAGVQATDNGEADRADTDASKATPQDTSPGTMQAASQDAAQNAGRKKPKEQARRAALTYAKKAPPLSMDDFLGKIQRLEATDAACPPPAGEALWETAARLAGQKETPADEEFCRLVERLCAQARSDGADVLASPSLAQALALAEACRLQKLPLCGELAQRLQLATGTALPDAYGSFNLANAFPPEPRLESLALAAYLRALAVSAGDGQDYRLLDRCHLYLNDFD
ncbi:MAG: hypothetical protein II515_03320, partial [Desulfovibrio sp.]|nr:hypothetical protein [Desulfovibrio sp.]